MNEKMLLTYLKIGVFSLIVGAFCSSAWASQTKKVIAIILAVLFSIGAAACIVFLFIMLAKKEQKERKLRETELMNSIDGLTNKTAKELTDEEKLEQEKDPLKRIELIAKIAKAKRAVKQVESASESSNNEAKESDTEQDNDCKTKMLNGKPVSDDARSTQKFIDDTVIKEGEDSKDE